MKYAILTVGENGDVAGLPPGEKVVVISGAPDMRVESHAPAYMAEGRVRHVISVTGSDIGPQAAPQAQGLGGIPVFTVPRRAEAPAEPVAPAEAVAEPISEPKPQGE